MFSKVLSLFCGGDFNAARALTHDVAYVYMRLHSSCGDGFETQEERLYSTLAISLERHVGRDALDKDMLVDAARAVGWSKKRDDMDHMQGALVLRAIVILFHSADGTRSPEAHAARTMPLMPLLIRTMLRGQSAARNGLRDAELEACIAEYLARGVAPALSVDSPMVPKIEKGMTLLDDFTVMRRLGQGAMGKVWLVNSELTGRQFAVKRAHSLDSVSQREFLRELLAWMELPKHPNIVPCHFFRINGNEVFIFAEYISGGSLRDWINSGKLYEGGQDASLGLTLDILIQIAWALDCLHRRGVVHQDVKPSNMLLGTEADVSLVGVRARITDFGISRMMSVLSDQDAKGEDNGTAHRSPVGSPYYQSPEAIRVSKATPKMDMWSWGVSALEMFTGGVEWFTGRDAAKSLEDYLARPHQTERPKMLQSVASILAGCFRYEPAERWEDMSTIVNMLREAYKEATGEEYLRSLTRVSEPEPSPEEPFWRLTQYKGMWMDPRCYLDAIPDELHDPGWTKEVPFAASRKGRAVGDLMLYRDIRRFAEESVAEGESNAAIWLAELLCNEAAVLQVCEDYEGALHNFSRTIDLLQAIPRREFSPSLAQQLASAHQCMGVLLMSLGRVAPAEQSLQSAIAVVDDVRLNWSTDQSTAEAVKGFLLSTLGAMKLSSGHLKESVTLSETALDLLTRARSSGIDTTSDPLLALCHLNKASALTRELKDLDTALKEVSMGIDILSACQNEGLDLFGADLARAYQQKEQILSLLGETASGAALNDSSLALLAGDNLGAGGQESETLAVAYSNKAFALAEQGERSQARTLFRKAEAILREKFEVQSQAHQADALARVLSLSAGNEVELGDTDKALSLYDEAIGLMEKLVNEKGLSQLAQPLVMAYRGKGEVLVREGREEDADDMYIEANNKWNDLIFEEGRRELRPDLASLDLCCALLDVDADGRLTEHAVCDIQEEGYTIKKAIERNGRTDLAPWLEIIAVADAAYDQEKNYGLKYRKLVEG